MASSSRYRLTLAVLVLAGWASSAGQVSADPTPAVPTVTAASDIGITAESLVVANLQSYAPTILTAIDAQLSRRSELLLLRQSIDEVVQTITAATREIQSAGNTSELQNQLQAAQASLVSLQQQLETKHSELRDLVTDGLPAAGLALLDNWREAATFKVDPQFRAAARTEIEWKDIEGAFRAEKRAIRRGTTLETEQATLLADLRSDADVNAAAARLTAHLATVQAVFDEYVPDEPE